MRQAQSPQLPEERRTSILQAIRDRGLIRVVDMAKVLGVSAETVRRDLVALERQGRLERLYGGGARLVRHRSLEAPFGERQVKHLAQKQAMARLAAALVEPEDTIILDVGTSVAQVARHLPPRFRGRVLTNSIRAAMELEARVSAGVELFVAGGRLRPGDMALSGTEADTFYRHFFADRAFLGSGGVHLTKGLTDYYVDEVTTRRIILDSAREKYVMADSSKLGHVAVAKVCDLAAITAVVTDEGVSDDVRQAFERAGVKLLIAQCSDDSDQ